MWLAALEVITWIVDAIGVGYMPAILLIWVLQHSSRITQDHMLRALYTTNTLVPAMSVIVCITLVLKWLLRSGIFFKLDGDFLPSSWSMHPRILVQEISEFCVLGLLPLVFLKRAHRTDMRLSLLVVLTWFLWGNAMDYLRHGYICYCDHRPTATYLWLLLTFLVLFGAVYRTIGRKQALPR